MASAVFSPASATRPLPSAPSTPAAVASALATGLPSWSGYPKAPPSPAQGRAAASRASYGDLPPFFTVPGSVSVAARAPMTTEVELASLGLPGV